MGRYYAPIIDAIENIALEGARQNLRMRFAVVVYGDYRGQSGTPEAVELKTVADFSKVGVLVLTPQDGGNHAGNRLYCVPNPRDEAEIRAWVYGEKPFPGLQLIAHGDGGKDFDECPAVDGRATIGIIPWRYLAAVHQ
nr:MAG: hypothetical protein BECKLPF1236C_GA0070990_102536 [Candidatus Kentron sp. LPFa]